MGTLFQIWQGGSLGWKSGDAPLQFHPNWMSEESEAETACLVCYKTKVVEPPTYIFFIEAKKLK